jgi:esterase/lipase superfamily enzyme
VIEDLCLTGLPALAISALVSQIDWPLIAMRPLCLFIVFLMALSGCAGHGVMSFIDQPANIGTLQTVFVATNRAPDTNGEIFNGKRSAALSYASYVISVPLAHQPGKVEWAEGKPDAATDFVTVDRASFAGSSDFKSAIDRAVAGKSAAQREAVVFVHGFNTSYAEGVYRLAQIKNDFRLPGIAVNFSWPSAAETRYYVYDRDSIAMSRDALQTLLNDLAESSVSKITLVAHSMGTYLTVETLRQMAMLNQTKFQRKLGPVVLMSPDIDVDVFKSQIARLDPFPKPFIIFTSSKDKALKVSALLTGQKQRLGSLSSIKEIGNAKITVVDVSNFKGGDRLDHFAVATSPALIKLINGILESGGGGFLEPQTDINPVTAPVHILRGVTGIILDPLER